jgi:hypothetical protein
VLGPNRGSGEQSSQLPCMLEVLLAACNVHVCFYLHVNVRTQVHYSEQLDNSLKVNTVFDFRADIAA